MMRILITGSQGWTNRPVIRDALAEVWHPDAVLISGACERGADALCEDCWTHWGGRVERRPADWRTHGRAAGIIRNLQMVALGANVCLAFILDGSPGASHCAAAAEAVGIPTRRFVATSGEDLRSLFERSSFGSPQARRAYEPPPAHLVAGILDQIDERGTHDEG